MKIQMKIKKTDKFNFFMFLSLLKQKYYIMILAFRKHER
jgi:hypothetical protein